MGSFEDSAWAREEFSRNYLNNADIYIMERRKLFALAASFVSAINPDNKPLRVLELGSGDGELTEELLRNNPALSVTLLDGSADMLDSARKRLESHASAKYIHATFSDLLERKKEIDGFDICISSMAIHHLSLDEKRALFRLIHDRMATGGGFLNIDVLLAPSDWLEAWYFRLWRSWMSMMIEKAGTDGDPEPVIRQYKDPASMNRPDTMESQLDAMREAGFRDVDCFYKNGIFAVYGGSKSDREP